MLRACLEQKVHLMPELSSKSSMFLRYFATGILLLVLQAVTSAQITAEVALDSTNLTIGDQVQLHITVKHADDIQINDIDVPTLEAAENFEILNVSPWDTLSRGLIQKHVTIQVWDSGYYFIPSVPISYNRSGETRSVTTRDLAFSVSTIPQNEAELAPIKPIIEEPRGIEDYMWFILAILVLALVGLAIRFFGRQKEPKVVAPPVVQLPPHETALAALKALEAKQLWQKGDIKAYHSELSYILRNYLEGRYGVQALEMTTSEIHRQLQDLDFDTSWKDQLTNMLQAVDMVKFAKAEPSVQFHTQSMESVKSFVLATKQADVEEEVPAAD